MRPSRFNLHVAARLLGGFLFFVGALVLFFVVLHYVEYSDDFADQGATAAQVFGTYYPNYVPEIVRLISPLALFLSSVYITGKLAQNLELAALQTSGVSLYRLMVPHLVLGVLLTGGMFYFNGWVVPHANRAVLAFESEYLGGQERTDVSDVHQQNRPGQIVTVGYYDEDDRTAHRVSIQRFSDEQRLVARTDAQNMAWVDSLGVWRLEDVTQRSFPARAPADDSAGATAMQVRHVETIDTTLQIYPRNFARTGRDVKAMTITEAKDYVAALQRTGAGEMGRPLVAYHAKYSYPLANLILLLISVPLAARRRRGGQTTRVALGLLVAFVYLALQKLTEPFGYAGDLSPVMTAWLPHAAFAVVALVMLWRARK
ncbi:MAG: YjgP/YjgQ family permease [Bacteroidetes bacterium QS_1_65_9]|nr:MAG: YjgP/YjgQ family permease [Bacteroidetes bacterium QS_8_68_15]PSQ80287.1 MAG: YjgP/YjgQ family permease [Bacteroidetes bacterium QS_1_65_9]